MVQPHYSNAFTVTYNPKLGEMVINFSQEYPMLNEQPQVSNTGALQIQTTAVREDVCGVVLPKEVARQLIDIMQQAITAPAPED